MIKTVFLLIFALWLAGCNPQKRCQKYKELWLAELVIDTTHRVVTVVVPPITVTDTFNLTAILRDTTWLYKPVTVTDTNHRVMLRYWQDKYHRLYLSCTALPDTVRVPVERIIIRPPPAEDREGIGWYWKIVIILGLLICIGILIKTILK